VTTSGDTQVLTRIQVPGAPAGPLPTVALTLDVTQELAAVRAEKAPVAPAEEAVSPVAPRTESHPDNHEDIYEEAMATIAALASNWSSAVRRTTGRHRAAA
jgi:hypothetical protein